MRVRALHEVYYDGKNHKAGDEFDVQDEHGRLMIIGETVEEMVHRMLKAEEPQSSKRRDYRRRDMRADE